MLSACREKGNCPVMTKQMQLNEPFCRVGKNTSTTSNCLKRQIQTIFRYISWIQWNHYHLRNATLANQLSLHRHHKSITVHFFSHLFWFNKFVKSSEYVKSSCSIEEYEAFSTKKMKRLKKYSLLKKIDLRK